MTTLATLALVYGERSATKSAPTYIKSGFQWISQTKPDDEAQSLALRLLLATHLKRPRQELVPWIKLIEERQNTGGGWSQIPNEGSDAWATGQALYALAHSGVAATNATVARGQSFLVRTQSTDGSWPMKSRPTKPGASGAKNLMPITGAGSAWAVMGLVTSKPADGN